MGNDVELPAVVRGTTGTSPDAAVGPAETGVAATGCHPPEPADARAAGRGSGDTFAAGKGVGARGAAGAGCAGEGVCGFVAAAGCGVGGLGVVARAREAGEPVTKTMPGSGFASSVGFEETGGWRPELAASHLRPARVQGSLTAWSPPQMGQSMPTRPP